MVCKHYNLQVLDIIFHTQNDRTQKFKTGNRGIQKSKLGLQNPAKLTSVISRLQTKSKNLDSAKGFNGTQYKR